jgi:hypothetical protein
MKGLDGCNRMKGRKTPRKFNMHIPSVREVFGEPAHYSNTELTDTLIFFPTSESIKKPIRINTSKMALQWAKGLL